jgi:parvulin-like peptidyl-prolyl isomerase
MSAPHNVETTRRRFSGLARLFREPLLQFVVIGAVLFVAAHGIAKDQEDASRRILVDSTVVGRLANLYEMQTGSQPSRARLDALIDDYVRQEVSFREALKMGLDQNDEIIRRRLVQKWEFLERDLVVIPDPSDAALERYYEQNRAHFTDPPTVTFSHVFFSPDSGGSDAAKRRAEAVLRRVQSQKVLRAPDAGDRFPLQRDYAGLNNIDVAQLFGQFPIVDAVFSSPTGRWVGPVESGYGWHLIFISRRKAATLPPFASIKDRVKQAYLEVKRREASEKKFEGTKLGYAIVRTYGNGAR